MNAFIFGALAMVSLSRLLSTEASTRTVGHVAVLLAICVFAYLFASRGGVLRVWGIAAFVIAWFWMPIVPLLGLLAAGLMRQPADARPPTAQPAPPVVPGVGEMDRAVFALATAANEFKDRVKAFAVDFGSIYGSQQIPFIAEVDGREHGVYVETAPWDRPAKNRFYNWMAALRTSDREDLALLIRSPHAIPVEVSRYVEHTPANSLELAAAMNVHWTDTPGLAELNSATVKRLVHEYFKVSLGNSVQDLEQLDRLVAERLAGRGEPLPSTLVLLGCYFGEVLVRQLGGKWVIAGQTTADVRVDVVTPRGALEVNVFGKASKLLHNGMADSMAWMARSIEQRINEQAAKRQRDRHLTLTVPNPNPVKRLIDVVRALAAAVFKIPPSSAACGITTAKPMRARPDRALARGRVVGADIKASSPSYARPQTGRQDRYFDRTGVGRSGDRVLFSLALNANTRRPLDGWRSWWVPPFYRMA